MPHNGEIPVEAGERKYADVPNLEELKRASRELSERGLYEIRQETFNALGEVKVFLRNIGSDAGVLVELGWTKEDLSKFIHGLDLISSLRSKEIREAGESG